MCSSRASLVSCVFRIELAFSILPKTGVVWNVEFPLIFSVVATSCVI